MPVSLPAGARCGCDRRTCFEEVFGGLALVEP